ncbi:MAG: alpha/beta fold hydrolase [Oligoflexia bacterium]|nr:alpha/beta fold hydrolase [Oligoflexia bacterium]
MITFSREITLSDDTKIYAEIFEKNHPSWLIITHDFGEHCGRYNNLAKVLNENFNVLTYDLRDHGKSKIKNTPLLNFCQYICDLEEILIFLRDEYRMNQFILLGHSIGALITLGYVQQKQFDTNALYPQKIFVSAPPVSTKLPFAINLFSITPLTNSIFLGPKKRLRSIASKVINLSFSLPMQISLPVAIERIINPNKLTHDTLTSEALIADTLSKKSIDLRLLISMVDYSSRVFSRPINPHVPLAVTFGSKDDFVKIKAIRHYFAAIEKEAHLKAIDGAYHDLHNEISRFKMEYQSYLLNFLKS